MIFIFPQGRFGNQIFQYMFAKNITKKNEKIFTVKMEYFNVIDEKNNFITFNGKKLYKYFNFGFDKILNLLAKLRIINGIYQNIGDYKGYKGKIDGYKKTKGLFHNMTYIDGYFIYEGEHIYGKEINTKSYYNKQAKIFIDKIPKKNYRVFIHIRRGDYLKRSVMGKNNLSLPINFYKKQINFLQKKYQNISFIFLSDDINRCKNEFNYIEGSLFSENDIGTDFVIMTLCDGAIISASTLSYSGAYFMKNKIEIFAPKYWLGFKDKVWYPKGIKTKKFSYISI